MSGMYQDISDSIVEAVREGVEGRDIAVAFSGGLDSGLVSAIARKYANSVRLYTCGTTNAYDVVMARDLSVRLGLPWVHVAVSKGMLEERIREMISNTGITDPFTISYELPLYCVCRESTEEVMLTGQGADEYFMGCAKFVGQTDEDYITLRDAGVERLLEISVPAERTIAAHFGKGLVYPYLDDRVTAGVAALDPEKLRPTDMDSRKAVLKQIAIDLGHPYLASRKKKSSQYGSGVTDLIRALAREHGMMFNEYVASLTDMVHGRPRNARGSVINARIDSILKVEAERIIQENGMTVSEAVDSFYRRIVREGGLDWIKGDE